MAELAQSEIEVIITVAEDQQAQLKQLAAQLQGKGLTVTQTMESLGMISGTVKPGDLERLRDIDGVEVAPAGEVHIAPPESDIQ